MAKSAVNHNHLDSARTEFELGMILSWRAANAAPALEWCWVTPGEQSRVNFSRVPKCLSRSQSCLSSSQSCLSRSQSCLSRSQSCLSGGEFSKSAEQREHRRDGGEIAEIGSLTFPAP